MRVKNYSKFHTLLVIILILAICGVGIFIGLSSHKTVYAESSEPSRNKYYTSIQINSGDTLWSIAKENITAEYKDLNSYIDEVKETNSLATDKINEGKFLLIPYYADTPRN